MATGTAQPTRLPPPPPAPMESRERERIIRLQLARTGWQVRLVDLASSIAVWVIGVLLLFIVAALFDHFFGLGSIGRFLALAFLAGCSLWYLAMQVAPLLWRTINPAYAARTIEEATPTLKNSLINFLLLRHDRSGLKEIVYQAVEQQAATDIATVPVEATVDRTRLIHAGYALCVVMAIFAAYKILSPKDPFQTVARVLAPWAEIARPSRVQISEVEPGSAEVYHGQTVPIFATVRGAREGDKVTVLYSTADGQTTDRPIAMKLSAGNRYECELPPESSGPAAASGLLQNVVYRIVAGDAETFPYRLTVVSAPTIIVDRLEYQYPAYAKKSADSFRQQGDIKALEGTKVTVHAVANQPIKSAWVEFDPTTNEAAAEIVPLAADGTHAQGTITLLLKPDRQLPWHATYQVRFYNERGQRSQQPILHKIEVIRDLAPEVQMLQPERPRIEVPEDGEQTIEVRAVDPDFGLTSLRLEGIAAGKPPVSINLLEDAASQPPQITVTHVFRPREHKLVAGDELRFAAVAEDNRASPLSGQPEPNSTRTKEYTLVITAPQKAQERGPGGKNQQPAAGAEPKNDPQAERADNNSQKPPQNEQPRQPDQKNPQPMNDGGQGNQEQRGNQQEPPKDGQQKSQPQQGQQNNQQGGNSQQPGGQQQNGGQQGEQQKQPQQGNQQQGGQSAGGQQSDGQDGGQQQGQTGAKGGSGSQQQSNPSGGGESGNSAGQGGKSGQATGNRQQSGNQPGDRQGDQAGDPNGSGENSGKARHDGQAIERIWKDIQKHDQQQNSGQSQPAGDKQPTGEEHPSGDKAQGQPKSDSKESNGKGQPASNEQGGQPQSAGSSGTQGQNTPNTGTPTGNDQSPKASGKGEPSQGKADKGGSKLPNDKLPDEKLGQNPSEQQSGGNKGGSPGGASKTDKGEKSSPSKGENRDPGAGDTGKEGAGQASQDKTGSGEGTSSNRDRDKQLPPDGGKAGKSEASPASSSRKQSDSKGGDSGSESGGGKKGAGQSAGQEGNDSPGSKSAADQGAGKANETGSGETGSKAGQQQKSEGKTGQRGKEAGDGSASRAGGDKPGSGPKPGKQEPGDSSKGSPNSGAREAGKSGGTGSEAGSGGNDDRQRSPDKPSATEEQEADAANLDYARKATEMVLKRLKDEEHNTDPELLDKLGWTREDLAEFLRRWDALQKTANENPAGKRELDEALKSLGLRDPASHRRAGGKTSDNQRDLRDAGNRSAPPPRYRDLFDAFRKGAARSAP